MSYFPQPDYLTRPVFPADIEKVDGSANVIGSPLGAGEPFGEVRYSSAATASSLAFRDAAGRLLVTAATLPGHVAVLSNVTALTNAKPAVVALTPASTAADIVAALQV